MWITSFVLVVTIIFSIAIFSMLRKEQRRNRVLQAFMAGIIRSVSDYQSKTDAVDPDDVPKAQTQIPIPYSRILGSVMYEFSKDFWMTPYQDFMKRDRSLFVDEKYSNDGFNLIYLDFIDELKRLEESRRLLTETERTYLREDLVVHEGNADELRGEVSMFKDLLAGQLNGMTLERENLASKLLVMFSHIKREHRDKLKEEILKRT